MDDGCRLFLPRRKCSTVKLEFVTERRPIYQLALINCNTAYTGFFLIIGNTLESRIVDCASLGEINYDCCTWRIWKPRYAGGLQDGVSCNLFCDLRRHQKAFFYSTNWPVLCTCFKGFLEPQRVQMAPTSRDSWWPKLDHKVSVSK